LKILVTGAAGYIAGHLIRELSFRGHSVRTQDIAPGPDVDNVFDLADYRERSRWLEFHSPDMVIHLAALYGRVWGEKNLSRTVQANTGMTAELARDTARAGARLMFISSSEVYGKTADQRGDVLTTMPLLPLNMYGLSKKWGEEACQLYAPDGLMITRLNMPYGPAAVLPDPGTVPRFSGRAGVLGYNVLHTMLWQASHGMPITVHKGTARCFTYVGDTCRGLAMIAESGYEGVWNVNRNDDHVIMSTLAEWCRALVPGCASEITEEEPPGQVTLRKRLDSDRLWEMGWRPQVDLVDGMKMTLDYVSRYDRDGRWQG